MKIFPDHFFKRFLLAPIALLLIVLALYSGSLYAPFVFDDFTFFASPENLARYNDPSKINIRWLPYSSLALQIHWGGLNVFWLRLGNVLLHSANAIALFFFLRQLFQAALPSNENYPPRNIFLLAFGGALIFAVHPAAVYGVTYIIQRSILMATLFVLLMLMCFLHGLQRNDWRWMIAAASCYFFAVYSKEHSITAPALALAISCVVQKPSTTLLKKTAPFYILSIPIAISIFLASKSVVGEAYEPHAAAILNLAAQKQGIIQLPSSMMMLSMQTQSLLFFKYIGLWLFPNPAWMSIDMREPFAMSLLSWPHSFGFTLFLLYPCVAVWLLLKPGKSGLLGFALLFPWLLFLTELSTVRAQEPFVLYRSYLWMIGLFAAMPVLFYSRSPKQLGIILITLTVLLTPLTLNRLNTFTSALALWDDAEKLAHGKQNLPGIERIYTNRGNKLFQLKRFDEAIADFTQSIATYPGDELVYGSRAKAYYFTKKYPEALADFNHAISIKPDSKRLYYDRALTYKALGNEQAAFQDLQHSCALGGVCP